jgi:hypothetical protein
MMSPLEKIITKARIQELINLVNYANNSFAIKMRTAPVGHS